MEYDHLRFDHSSLELKTRIVYVYFDYSWHMHELIQFLNQSMIIFRCIWKFSKNKPISLSRLKYLPVIWSKKLTNWTSLCPIKSSKTNISYWRRRKQQQQKNINQLYEEIYYCIDLIEIRLTWNICITHFICQMSRWSNVHHSMISFSSSSYFAP